MYVCISVYVRVVMKYVPLTFFLRSNLVREEALKKAGVPVGGPMDEEKEDDGASNTSSYSVRGRYSKREREGERGLEKGRD